MTQIASIDFSTQRISLHADTVLNGFDAMQAYFELNALIISTSAYQQYDSPLSAEGNISKGGGKFTPRYVLMQANWRFIPYLSVAHTLRILVEIVSLDGLSGIATFDRSTVSVNVDIDEGYEKIEIREVTTGGTTPALTASESAQLAKMDSMTFTKANELDVNVITQTDGVIEQDKLDIAVQVETQLADDFAGVAVNVWNYAKALTVGKFLGLK